MNDAEYQIERLVEGLNKQKRINTLHAYGNACSGVASLFAVCVLSFLLIRGDIIKYFAVTPELRIMELVPLNEPTVTDAGLRDWVADTVAQTLSLNFLKWREQLGSVRGNYTNECFTQIVQNMEESGNLKYVTSKRLSCAAIMDSPPIIIRRGILNGVFTWDLQVPVTVSYESSARVENVTHSTAFIRVSRVASTRHPRGIAIEQLVLQ